MKKHLIKKYIMRDSKGRFIKGHIALKEWKSKMGLTTRFSIGNTMNNGRKHDAAYSEKCRQRNFLRYRSKGLSTIQEGIRKLSEAKKWQLDVHKKSRYNCKNCNEHSKKLIAHHKKAFKSIMDEFLAFYNQFSWIEDRETLIRLAITYAPFWDVSNGGTLCKKCHDGFHLIYGRKGDNTIEQWDEFIGIEKYSEVLK